MAKSREKIALKASMPAIIMEFGQGWNEDVMAGGRWHNGDAVMMKSYGEGKAVYVGGVEQATGYVMLSNPKKCIFLMPECSLCLIGLMVM